MSEKRVRAKLIEYVELLAEKSGYKGLVGEDAMVRLLVDKYRWLFEQVRNLSTEDLNLLFDNFEKP